MLYQPVTPANKEYFVNSIVFLSDIMALVIMAMGNNLARAFGLVGALSIIRFRTAIKDTYILQFPFFDKRGSWNEIISDILADFRRRFEPVSLKTFEKGKSVEYSYYIRLKKHRNSNQLVNRLSGIEGVSNINLFYDQQNI